MTNKNIDYYMSLPYTIQIHPCYDFNGRTVISYYASVLEIEDLRGYGLTPEEAYNDVRKIMRIYFEARLKYKDKIIPEP